MAGIVILASVGAIGFVCGVVYPIIGVLLYKMCGSKLTIKQILRRL